MGRLAAKLAQAQNAIDGIEIAVGHDVDALIDRTKEVHKRREAVFLKKQMALDGSVSDLAEFEKDLEAFGKNDLSGVGENSGSAYTGVNPDKPKT
jgi:hypothetical protein